ncbi:hypothetical protein pb186bvf_010118 [Paramecium bursaria]
MEFEITTKMFEEFVNYLFIKAHRNERISHAESCRFLTEYAPLRTSDDRVIRICLKIARQYHDPEFVFRSMDSHRIGLEENDFYETFFNIFKFTNFELALLTIKLGRRHLKDGFEIIDRMKQELDQILLSKLYTIYQKKQMNKEQIQSQLEKFIQTQVTMKSIQLNIDNRQLRYRTSRLLKEYQQNCDVKQLELENPEEASIISFDNFKPRHLEIDIPLTPMTAQQKSLVTVSSEYIEKMPSIPSFRTSTKRQREFDFSNIHKLRLGVYDDN